MTILEALFHGFLVFCRVGGCFMFLAGFAGARIPVQVRLLVAASISLLLAPIVPASASGEALPGHALFSIGAEIITGAIYGLATRFCLAGLQFGLNAATAAIGLSGMPGTPIDDAEPQPAIVTIFSLAAVVVLFSLDLHLLLIRKLFHSYEVLPLGGLPAAGDVAQRMLVLLASVFDVSLRLCAPFIAYAILINFAIGLASKFTPQISIYFAVTGAMIFAGLLLLHFVAAEWLMHFASAYAGWIEDI